MNERLTLRLHFLTEQQELEATGETGATKRRTLQELFRPPIDVLHKGTFETVTSIIVIIIDFISLKYTIFPISHFPFIFPISHFLFSG
jgi:hypothetical protein